MPQIRPHDEPGATLPANTPETADSISAGERYRQHLERFPERTADNALERAARALVRIAHIRAKAPPRAD